MIAGGELGPRPLHPRRLSAGLAARGDGLLVAARAGQGRRELRDRRHRIALVRSRAARHRPAHRRGPRRSHHRGRHAAEAVGVDRGVRAQRRRRARSGPHPAARISPRCCCASTTAPRAASRWGRSAPATRTGCGSRSTAGRRRCAGSRNGRTSCGSAAATRPTPCSQRIRRCSRPARARYAHLPGGHQEGWADAFCNVMRDVYGVIARGRAPGDAAAAGLRHLRRRISFSLRRRRHSREPPAGQGLDDGRRGESDRSSPADVGELRSRRRPGRCRPGVLEEPMKLGVFTPVFGTMTLDEVLAKVQRAAARAGARDRHRRLAGQGSSRHRRAARQEAVRGRLPPEDRRRRPDDQRALVPRQPAASRRRDRQGRRRSVAQDGAPRRAARGAGGRDVLRAVPATPRARPIPTGSPRRGRRSFSTSSTGSGRRRRSPTGTARRISPPITA